MSVNRVILLGNLGADPEMRTLPTGRAVCNLSVATNESYKDASGAKVEKTEWHRIAVWGPQAESCAKYLTKGRTVFVEGKLQTRSYDKDGVKHYATDIVADHVTFVGHGDAPRDAEGGQAASPRGRWGGDQKSPVGNAGDGGDDIPL